MDKLNVKPCSLCGNPLRFVERVKSNKQYRIRRYECTVCDNKETVFADGQFKDKMTDYIAKRDIEKYYKEQEGL